MDTNSKKHPVTFMKGQLWKVDNAYIQIVDHGKRLIHYKMMKQPGQKAVLTRIIRPDAFAVYLMATAAVPMDSDQLAA